MVNQRSSLGIVLIVLLAGCGGSSGAVTPAASLSAPAAARDNAAIPSPFKCLPDFAQSSARAPHIAYASTCSVAKAPKSAALQKLAVAMMVWNGSAFIEYCTGTPIAYDSKTHVGFVVTAGHCVVGGKKAAGAKIRAANIITFDPQRDRAEIYQGTPAIVPAEADLNARIMAVYTPSQYCKKPAFRDDGTGCSEEDEQNGDVTVLKVQTRGSAVLGVLPSLRVAPANLKLAQGQLIMALGYGLNTSRTPADRVLDYIDYQYFATDKYKVVRSQTSIMNGYVQNGHYYSIICQGDSGGGDFAWDGKHWNLVGAHSWGPNPCGVNGDGYRDAFDVSSDVRPFGTWINAIVTGDTSPTGCASLGAPYVCASRPG